MGKKKVIVLAGGGAKGMLQVEILKQLEDRGELKDIDLIFGSSVGAINGSILASGKLTANEMRNIYPDMLKQIFKKKFIPIPPIYNRKQFFDIWMNKIGMIKMKDVKTKLVISTIDFCKKEPHFFKSWDEDNAEEYVMTVVARSFAAPYFFDGCDDDVFVPTTNTLLLISTTLPKNSPAFLFGDVNFVSNCHV